MFGKNLNTLKIRNILKRRNASITERLDREEETNNVVMDGIDKNTMMKSNLSQPFDQNCLKPYSLILTIISIAKKIVIRISKCNSSEFFIPDSVMNIIIVLMTIIDNITLSLINIFLKFDNIIHMIL